MVCANLQWVLKSAKKRDTLFIGRNRGSRFATPATGFPEFPPAVGFVEPSIGHGSYYGRKVWPAVVIY